MCRSLSMPSLWARPTGLYAIRKDSTHFQFTLWTGLLYLRGKERRESFHFLSPHPWEIDFDSGFLGSVVLTLFCIAVIVPTSWKTLWFHLLMLWNGLLGLGSAPLFTGRFHSSDDMTSGNVGFLFTIMKITIKIAAEIKIQGSP